MAPPVCHPGTCPPCPSIRGGWQGCDSPRPDRNYLDYLGTEYRLLLVLTKPRQGPGLRLWLSLHKTCTSLHKTCTLGLVRHHTGQATLIRVHVSPGWGLSTLWEGGGMVRIVGSRPLITACSSCASLRWLPRAIY